MMDCFFSSSWRSGKEHSRKGVSTTGGGRKGSHVFLKKFFGSRRGRVRRMQICLDVHGTDELDGGWNDQRGSLFTYLLAPVLPNGDLSG